VTSGDESKDLDQASCIILRQMTLQDMEEFTRLARESIEFHRPWIYAPTTPEEFENYLSRFDQRTAECLLICTRDGGTMVGFATVSQIVRAPYQRGTLGYGAFVHAAGKGYISAGIRLLFRHAFDELDLHRLEADIQPHNEASLRLVKRLGFRREGYSPEFILISGVWRDHERWAITSNMFNQQRD
jgi:ribosomal-protein-alanine N-acetyltransferase